MSDACDHIAGVPVVELARRFGTPTFVYDAAVIRQKIADVSAFDVVRFAQKACSNLAVLDLVRRFGALVDAVSAGEIHRALKAGFSPSATGLGSATPSATGLAGAACPPPIVYTADIFDRESLDLCVRQNIHVNCGSPEMIDQLGSRAPGRDITLRINPGFGHGHSRKTNTGGDCSKHGIWHTQIGDCLERAGRRGLSVSGLHIHIGSGTDLEHLSRVAGAMEGAAAEVGPSLVSLSAGGGLPTIYQPGDRYVDLAAYFALWDAARKRLEERFGHALRLEIEPGRYLMAESGFLLAEIRAVKRQDANLFYLADAGFNNLARPILYGSYHPMSIVPADGGPRGPERDVIVGGPLCESGDIFTQEEGGFVVTRRLADARVGDLLLIGRAGAYGFTMSSNYNSKPLAAEVLIDGGQPRLIRRRQTFDDLIQGETLFCAQQ